jgi:hypothetical protein
VGEIDRHRHVLVRGKNADARFGVGDGDAGRRVVSVVAILVATSLLVCRMDSRTCASNLASSASFEKLAKLPPPPRATAASFAASPAGSWNPITLTMARVRPLLIRAAAATGSPSHVSSPSETT